MCNFQSIIAADQSETFTVMYSKRCVFLFFWFSFRAESQGFYLSQSLLQFYPPSFLSVSFQGKYLLMVMGTSRVTDDWLSEQGLACLPCDHSEKKAINVVVGNWAGSEISRGVT